MQNSDLIVDWPQLILELVQLKLSIYTISKQSDIPKSTLMGWRNLGVEPKHSQGEKLIRYWMGKTGKQRSEIPLRKPVLSAFRAS